MAKPRRFKPERISKMSARDILRISDERLRKATTSELNNLVARAQSLFGKRMHSIYKQGLGDFAYAAESKIDPLLGSKTPESRYEAGHMLAMFRSFFRSRTSTPQGIRAFIKEEESRLSSYAKRDIHFNTESQRKNFWSTYMEFLLTNKTFDEKVWSERIQQALGEMTFWSDRGFTADDLTNLLEVIYNRNPDEIPPDYIFMDKSLDPR